MISRFSLQSFATPAALDASDGDSHPDLQFLAFPGGERHVRLPASVGVSRDRIWTLTAHLHDTNGVMDLLLTADALRRATRHDAEIHLVMPYVPYARQDRVALPGEPLSAAVFCRLVNSLNFASVTIADPHSDVTPALLDRVRILPAAHYVQALLTGALVHLPQVALVAPDVGARKRVELVAKAVGAPVAYATKTRDPVTGKLSSAEVSGELPDLPLLIVDDICDGGGTFIALAQVLRGKTSQPLFLYVTHGLFTKGLTPLQPWFDGIFAAHCADPTLADTTRLTPAT
ncbi:MAG: ribose-phosphate diphosphokinase [Roseateles sp.]|uniref:ribose-phosphate diphosphokinase n=1 Tax=Roseateles sp. TaxID=1971397 RepID=UPI0039E80A00